MWPLATVGIIVLYGIILGSTIAKLIYWYCTTEKRNRMLISMEVFVAISSSITIVLGFVKLDSLGML